VISDPQLPAQAPLQLLIETDILAEFLVSDEPEPTLLRALKQHVCYTTMLNAFELLRAARSNAEHEAVHSLLTLVRVLGYNSRTAIPIASLTRSIEQEHSVSLSTRDALVVGMAVQSKLAILTRAKHDLYSRIDAAPVLRDVATTIGRERTENGSQNIFSTVGISQVR
jgi:predicted nucleic acid-binding protein